MILKYIRGKFPYISDLIPNNMPMPKPYSVIILQGHGKRMSLTEFLQFFKKELDKYRDYFLIEILIDIRGFNNGGLLHLKILCHNTTKSYYYFRGDSCHFFNAIIFLFTDLEYFIRSPWIIKNQIDYMDKHANFHIYPNYKNILFSLLS